MPIELRLNLSCFQMEHFFHDRDVLVFNRGFVGGWMGGGGVGQGTMILPQACKCVIKRWLQKASIDSVFLSWHLFPVSGTVAVLSHVRVDIPIIPMIQLSPITVFTAFCM